MLIIGTYTCVIISRNNDPCSTRNESLLDFLFILCRYLVKPGTTSNDLKGVRNDLKGPTTSKKRPERNDMKQSTTSKTQSTATWTHLQRAKKRCETTNNKQIFRLFYNMGQTILFSYIFFTEYLVAVIRGLLHGELWWKQSVKHLLSWVKHQLSCVFFMGYKIYLFLSGFCVSRERDRLFF